MQNQASRLSGDPGGGLDPLQFNPSFPMPNLASYTLPKAPPLSITVTGDGQMQPAQRRAEDGNTDVLGAKRKR